jgi:hypothetical protein
MPPRSSVTVTVPSRPVNVCELGEATCDDPSGTPAVGALIESAPAVKVNVTGVAAAAGREAAAARVAKLPASSRTLRIMRTLRY